MAAISASKIMELMVIEITNCAPATPEMKEPLLIAPFALSAFFKDTTTGAIFRPQEKEG